MNLYLQMEIKARELEGRSLLALVAAERGHHVLLGDLRRYLENASSAFPPGVFHDKSLTPSARKLTLHRRLVAQGFAITSQDEEHWLALPSFDVPARKRFSPTSLANAARSFAWGDHEGDALRAHYPEHADRIVVTGSPRVDLWRPEAASAATSVGPVAAVGDRDVVLVSSNFSAVLDVNPFWVRIHDKRQHFEGTEDPFEFDRYGFTSDKYRVLGEFVRAVRRLALRYPDVIVVVRPHPIEAVGAWDDLIGTVPNVLVSREATLIDWVRRAIVVVQNGCTSGYEAAVAGTPVISFHPDDVFADHPVNALGRRASDQDTLAALIDDLLGDEGAARRSTGARSALPPGGEAVLRRRIAALDGRFAADRIADEFDLIAADLAARPWSPGTVAAARRAVRVRARLGRARDRLAGDGRGTAASGDAPMLRGERRTGRFTGTHKLPAVTDAELLGLVERLRRAFGRFDAVRVDRLGDDLVAFRPARGARPPAA